jgi:hypothetical protein
MKKPFENDNQEVEVIGDASSVVTIEKHLNTLYASDISADRVLKIQQTFSNENQFKAGGKERKRNPSWSVSSSISTIEMPPKRVNAPNKDLTVQENYDNQKHNDDNNRNISICCEPSTF